MATLNTIRYLTNTSPMYYKRDNEPIEDLEGNDIILNEQKIDITGGTMTGDLTVNGILSVNKISAADKWNLTGDFSDSTSGLGIQIQHTILHDVTTSATGYRSSFSLEAFGGYTLDTLEGIRLSMSSIGAGSTISEQYGVVIDSNFSGAGTNIGIMSQVPAGANNYNLYATSTAYNYLNGSLQIGTNNSNIFFCNLNLNKNIQGGTTAYSVNLAGTIQSIVTSESEYYRSESMTIDGYTGTDISHYRATQGTFDVGSVVSNQAGFYVDSTLVGAGTNYGFYSDIPTNGTANRNLMAPQGGFNVFVGKTSIGTTTQNTGNSKDAILQLKETSSSGIYLGNSNNGRLLTLDWYEEGVFTPTITGTTVAGTGTYTANFRNGVYTRIGNMVYISLAIAWTAHTGTGNLIITGLPFSNASVSNNDWSLDIVADSLTYGASNILSASITPGQNFIAVWQQASGIALVQVAMDSSAKIYLTGHYRAV